MEAAPFLFLLIPIGMTIATGYVADRKGRSFLLWAFIGFFLGIFGLLLAAIMPKKAPAY